MLPELLGTAVHSVSLVCALWPCCSSLLLSAPLRLVCVHPHPDIPTAGALGSSSTPDLSSAAESAKSAASGAAADAKGALSGFSALFNPTATLGDLNADVRNEASNYRDPAIAVPQDALTGGGGVQSAHRCTQQCLLARTGPWAQNSGQTAFTWSLQAVAAAAVQCTDLKGCSCSTAKTVVRRYRPLRP